MSKMRSNKSKSVYKKPPLEIKLPFMTNPDFDQAKSIYDFSVRDLNHVPVKLSKYKGKVCIIVNVCSTALGFSFHNYKVLNHLYDKYHKEGLRILAFPSNQFNHHETNEGIKKFMELHGVKFHVFDPINVNCEDAHPLWKYLKTTVAPPTGIYKVIKDPFTKFFISKNGTTFTRLLPAASEDEVEEVLQSLLGKFRRASDNDEDTLNTLNKVVLPPLLEPDTRPCTRPWRFRPGHMELI